MRCTCYLKKDTVLIPTIGKLVGGPHWATEPVAVVSVSDTQALRIAFKETIARGTPIVPRDASLIARRNQPLLPRYAGVKSIPAFERSTRTWNLSERDGIYEIVGLKLKEDEAYNGRKVTDPDQVETFPRGTSVETVIDRMITILQSAAKG